MLWAGIMEFWNILFSLFSEKEKWTGLFLVLLFFLMHVKLVWVFLYFFVCLFVLPWVICVGWGLWLRCYVIVNAGLAVCSFNAKVFPHSICRPSFTNIQPHAQRSKIKPMPQNVWYWNFSLNKSTMFMTKDTVLMADEIWKIWKWGL